MTRAFVRRWLKLRIRLMTFHILALVLVFVSAVLVLVALAWLPATNDQSVADSQPTPYNLQLSAPPAVSALYSLVLDPDSDLVLYSKSADEPVAPASTTKLMTALIVLENYPLNQVITIDRSFPEGQNIGLRSEEHTSELQ